MTSNRARTTCHRSRGHRDQLRDYFGIARLLRYLVDSGNFFGRAHEERAFIKNNLPSGIKCLSKKRPCDNFLPMRSVQINLAIPGIDPPISSESRSIAAHPITHVI